MPAQAAGPAVLSLEITAVDPVTGQDVTSTEIGQHNDRLAYRVGYSCSVADCTDATVTLPAFELDPTYGQFRMYRYDTWTPPAGGGASITNSATAGETIRLGNVAAGTSATFVVQYLRDIDTSAPGPVPASYFPPGYQIGHSATIASPNATASSTAKAAPVTWNIEIPTPSVQKTAPATVAPNTDFSYTIAMSSGCFENRGSARWTSTGRYLCAESYTVVDRLPAQAVFINATGGGVYDAASHTITWTASGASAAGGWGAATFANWNQKFGYGHRYVTVRYPTSAFPEGAGGADFNVPVTNDVDVSVTYLDDAATTKTTATSFTNRVVYNAPFGRADQAKASNGDQAISGQMYFNVPPDTTGLVCPTSGKDDWNRACTPGQAVAPYATRTEGYWSVDTANRGNVPGVATVVDNDLGNSDVRVRRISTAGGTGAPTIAWTITDGTTTTSGTTVGTSYTPPTGSWLTAATVTSGSLSGPNLQPSGNAGTLFRVAFGYDVPVGSPLFTWRNSASATMTYPGQPQIAPIPLTSTNTVTFRDMPKVAPPPVTPPSFSAGFNGAPVVEGGGQAVPGGKVTFRVSGATGNIPAGRDVSPQYVFIAPAGWNVTPNSASFAAGTVPPGVSYTYKNVTIAGVTRQAVIASWPTGATFGSNGNWPVMTVVASPTAAVAAGTNSVATMWVGDSRNAYTPGTTSWFGSAAIDSTDVDGDGNVTEAFASTQSAAVFVSGTSRLDVIKEICVVTDDECDWISNADITVGVDPDATDITYRVTLANGGNTVLSNVVGYDVLPFVGDPRGSTFGETLNTVTEQSSNLALSYSGSSNPCRVEVLPTNPGCADGWTAGAEGANSVRAAVNGTLAPGASASFVFSANVLPGAPAGAIACNSVAVDSGSTLPSEPRPVCATTQEADLQISVPDRLPLQAGRPGVVPFTVTNLGGSEAAPANVKIQVPAGIRITSLTPAGWVCAADETDVDGSVLGPATLSCDPVAADGASRMLALDEPNALNLPAVIPDDSLVGEQSCFPAEVSGLMSDPVDANNTASACFAVVEGESLIALSKDDGRDSAEIGDEFTYTVDVANLLAGEPLSNVVIKDELPATLAFVSASNGGAVADQGEADAQGLRPGGTVSWNIASLASNGQPGGNGDVAIGGAGSTQRVTVTVKVVQAAETKAAIVNTAAASATDPALPGVTLTANDNDTDALIHTPELAFSKSADASALGAPVMVGDVVKYNFSAANTGNVTLSGVAVTDPMAGLSELVYAWPGAVGVLAPGEVMTATATYALTQGDVDAGSVRNAATVTGTPAGSDVALEPVPGETDTPLAADASLAFVKSADVAALGAPVMVGDVVKYNFSATNTGNVTLSGVVVTDPMAGLSALTYTWPGVAGVLAPGEVVTATATYALKQSDVDGGSVKNAASATGTAPGAQTPLEPVPDMTDTPLVAAGSLAFSKVADSSALGAPVLAGDVVTYNFSATNTGNVTLSGVAVTDAMAGLSALTYLWPGVAGVLAPGEVVTATASYVLTQGDVDAGHIANVATATGTLPGSDVALEPVLGETDTVLPAGGALSLVKDGQRSGADDSAAAGDTIDYTFTATNTGNVTLSGVVVTDGLVGLSELAYAWPGAAGVLAPGEVVTATATYVLTQGDVDAGSVRNTASVTGTPPGNDVPLVPAPAVDVTDLPADASLAFVKSADAAALGAPVMAGDVVTYNFSATNTGNVTLSGVAVTDPMAGLSALTYTWPGADGVLAPGEVVTATAIYTLTQGDVDAGSVKNAATATGTPAGSDITLEPVQGETDTSLPAAASLAFSKSADAAALGAPVMAGDVVTYNFSATNTGNVTLSGVAITDPMAGLSALTYTWPGADGVLAPGEVVTATAIYTLIQADVDAGSVRNTASVTGTPAGSDVPLEPVPGTTDTPLAADASLEFSKVADSSALGAPVGAGDVVTYNFSATNTGNVTLSGVAITDPMAGLSELVYVWSGAAGVLAPGEVVTATASYVLTQGDVDAGSVRNTASVTGTPAGSDVPLEPVPGETDTPLAAAGSLAFSKFADAAALGAPVMAGDVVTYNFSATNTGNVTLSGVAVTDPMAGLSALTYLWPNAAGVLAPGEVVTATGTYTLTQGDVDAGHVANAATVTGTLPGSDVALEPVLGETDTVLPAGGALSLVKDGQLSGADDPVAAGDTVNYTFTATNTGNVTLSGVAVTDPMAGLSALTYLWPNAAGVLAPGEVVTATAGYVLTQGDVDSGSVRNTATVTGTVPGSDVPLPPAPAVNTTELPGMAKLGLVKAADSSKVGSPAEGGDVITYAFEARNAGNVTVNKIAISDAMPGLSALVYSWPGADGVLAPGEVVTATATYQLTASDAAAGSVTNKATVTGTPLGVAMVLDPASADVTVEFTPSRVPSQTPAAQPDELPHTGASSGLFAGGAAVLLMGMVVLAAARRRTSA